ncbi:GNAT family N-acetyltransferase [Flavisphingomonas formosensis]|uniref:GNAT family N-acetyltransferase n=1 Tax=Flavisphingomonas formosensis TaxID=861534 RepID=UPI0012FC559F|nr:GNAT family N-acetyltransferase [Sphingomonas formosensis]
MLSAEPQTLKTRTGIAIRVRPAEPSDEPLLARFFESVSADDRRFRFLTATDHVGHSQLAPMTECDHWQTETFVAFEEGDALPVATAMLACDRSMTSAEVAISVRADRKALGIGWTLLDHVARAAQRRGIRVLQSIESRDNHSAIELEREMGFAARPVEGDPTLVLLEARF